MMLADGLHDVPPGKVAAVVTHMEMRKRPDTGHVPAPAGWTLVQHERPRVAWYRALFRAVGDDWLWFSRTLVDDRTLEKIIHDPRVQIFSLQRDGIDGGMLELDFRQPGQCELAYFGLTAPLIGSGAGRYLMNQAIDRAWSAAITRFHVHTCTLDSPRAPEFYRRSGFVPYRQQVEIADDPRLAHGYDRALAPHVPIFE